MYCEAEIQQQCPTFSLHQTKTNVSLYNKKIKAPPAILIANWPTVGTMSNLDFTPNKNKYVLLYNKKIKTRPATIIANWLTVGTNLAPEEDFLSSFLAVLKTALRPTVVASALISSTSSSQSSGSGSEVEVEVEVEGFSSGDCDSLLRVSFSRRGVSC
jgi:hypothetical protein